MLSTYTWPRYAHRPAPQPQPRVPLVVVGAGPVGLCAAIDAAQRGQPVVLLDEDDTVSIGSRGLCWAQRTLEIFDRLGIGDAVVARGVTWNVGRTFHRDREVFSFDLQPEPGHRRPGMVNLQQYHVEQLLVERALALPLVDLRWQHRVSRVVPDDDGVTLQVETADGPYALRCDWLIAADGAKSPIRRQLGLDIEGRVFQDRFLIADVVLDAEPDAAERTERRFWFAPSFHAGQSAVSNAPGCASAGDIRNAPGCASAGDIRNAPGCASALMHREADNVWRIDFQLGADADPELEKQPERVAPRIRAVLDSQGLEHIGFDLEWVSVYTFQCRRMARFRHGRLLFAGDAAHQVSPFGARGANSGVQDVDNLVWKLDLVQRGLAPDALLDSYDAERGAAADENIRISTRSTDFMTPKSRASRVLRDAVLSLAAEQPFARALVNSGRLSVPTLLADSPLNTPDDDAFAGRLQPGAPAEDAPLWQHRWLLAELLAELPAQFTLLLFADAPTPEQLAGIDALAHDALPVASLLVPPQGLLAQRYDAQPGTAYLLRPDQHVAARWRRLDVRRVRQAVARAIAKNVAKDDT